MTWRRFTSGNFGALSARQYSEVQDAVYALTQRSGVSSAIRRPSPDTPMLVRIKGIYGQSVAGEPATGQGTEVIPATAYLFEQVFVRFNRASGTVEIAARDYGTRSRQGEGQDESLTLVAIDPRPFSNIPENSLATVYPLAVDAGDGLNDVPDQQGLYMIMPTSLSGGIGVYVVLAAMPGGMYSVRPDDDTSGTTEMMENLYETSAYYGALLGPQNPCATLTPGRLGPGDRVFGFSYGGQLVTCSPTPFSVACQPCGGVAESIQALYDSEGAEAAVVSRMLGG